MKNLILRELLIIILLSVVVILTLRMVIYDFIPNENMLPESIQYSADAVVQNILNEIEEENNKIENSTKESLLKTYKIEKTDLKGYVSKKEYKNRNMDPFENYVETSKNKNSKNR